jgi:hypothetical protein
MTPKEKAYEIWQKMMNADLLVDSISAKQCSLVAVDEIVKEIQCNEFDFQSNVPMSVYTYWKNVKQEIEKL